MNLFRAGADELLMRRGELKKVADDYAALLGPDWHRVKNDFFRLDDSSSWLQIIALNASRWASEYNPIASLDFLKMPGPVLGRVVPQILKHSRGSQRWITLREHAEALPELYDEIVIQFRPALTQPLSGDEILHHAGHDLSYWPHAYALCVLACERGDRALAQKYLAAFEQLTARKDYEEIEERRRDLSRWIGMIDSPAKLREVLNNILDEKLRAIGLRKTDYSWRIYLKPLAEDLFFEGWHLLQRSHEVRS